MKLWSYFDIPDWQNIRDNINKHIENSYPDIEKLKMLTFLPNDDVFNAAPNFEKWLDSQNISVVGFGIFTFRYTESTENITENTYGGNIVHTDLANPTNYRFNIPLLNTENSYTEFFNSPLDKAIEAPNASATNPSPTRMWKFGDEGPMIDSFILDRPAILHVKIPHRVRMTERKPRICLTVCPANDEQLLRFL
jgi:hypothetical protein